MKRIVKPNQNTDLSSLEPPKVPDVFITDISVDGLLGDGLQALRREVKNLLMLSAKGKLDAASARDLRDTVKLLFELKDREKDILESMSEEALQKAVETTDDN